MWWWRRRRRNGGGGGVIPTPTPTPVPTATPTINPFGCVGSTPYAIARTSSISHPIAAGDSFTYSGTLNNTYAQSAPCAQPTATSSATVTSTVAVSATTLPNGGGAGSDVQATEADAYATKTTTTITSQSVKNTASAYELFETKVSDNTGDSLDTVYTSPQVLDQLPETSGGNWTNGPAGTLTETLADGTHVNRTIASDGSYTDNEAFATGGTAAITVNGLVNNTGRDGSGVYALAGTTFTYSAPSGGNITLQIAGGATRVYPAWFAFTGTFASSYITDSFVDNGQQPFDASCSVNAGISAAADHQIVETHSVLDPVVGYVDTRTTTTYNVDGFGAACVKIADTLDSYYDYNDNTTKIDYQSQNGLPVSVDTLVEYLGMQSPATPYSSVRTQAVSPVAVAQRAAAIDLQRELQRSQSIRAMRDILMSNNGKGAAR